jgi:hypothetical protein
MSRFEDPAFADLVRSIEQSALGRIAGAARLRVRESLRRSRVLAAVAAAQALYGALPAAGQWRLAGVFMLAFAAGTLLLGLVVPLRAAPALPLLSWVAGLVGLLLVAGSSKLARTSR